LLKKEVIFKKNLEEIFGERSFKKWKIVKKWKLIILSFYINLRVS
jgi:hypothetical protein